MPRERQRRRELRRVASAPPPEPTPSALERLFAAPWCLPSIVAVAALLRAVHLIALRGSPLWSAVQLDHKAYDDWGAAIAGGDWLGNTVFFVDPLYAYFLGTLYAVFGHSPTVVRAVQLVLGLATVWLTARLGTRALGSVALGNLAALLVAFYIPAVHYETAIEKTALGVFLATLSLHLYLRPAPRDALFSGVVLGLAALTRGNLALLLPIGALAFFFDPGDRAARRRAALFAAGALAVLAIAAARNLAVSGDLVVTTANLGQNFYIGQQRQNPLGTYDPPPFVRPDPRYEESDFRAEAERRLGRELGASQVSSFWLLRGVDEIAAAPGEALARTWRKLRLFWHRHEVPDNDNVELIESYSPVLRLPAVWMGTLFPFALLGAAAGWRRREVRVIAAATAIYCVAVIAFFVLGRFRAPIVPSTSVLAAAGLAWCFASARAGSLGRLAAAAAVVAVTGAWTHVRPEWLEARRQAGLAIAYHNLGAELVAKGNVDAGIAAYERAVATRPEAVVASMRSLGEILLQRREYDRAETYMRRVIALKPESRLARQALVRLYEAKLAEPYGANDAATQQKLDEARRSAGR